MSFIQQYFIPTSSVQYYAVQNVQQLFASELVTNIVAVLKAVSLLLSLALFAGIVYFIVKTNVVGDKVSDVKGVVNPEALGKNRKIADMVRRAKSRLARVNAEEDRTAVVEAMHAVEEALKTLGHKGASMRDMIATVHAWKATSADQVLRAFDVRTRIVHYPHATVTHDETVTAVEVCEKALQDLGIM